MSKKNFKDLNIFKRIYLTYKFFGQNPLVSYCHYCHSYHIGKADEQTKENEYIGTYWCKKCGATMVLVEKWTKKSA